MSSYLEENYTEPSDISQEISEYTKLNKLSRIVHVLGFLMFSFGYVYDWLYVIYPPTIMKMSFSGKLQFVTYWDLILQAVYFSICLVNDIYGNTEINPKQKPFIRKVKDYMYATMAFPVAMFVGVQFWILMFIDRELVLPKALDPYFPTWLNHMMHTNIMVFTLLEMVMTFRQYPKRSDGLIGLITFMLIYLIWLHVIYAVSAIWVYPVLEVLDLWQRLVFFLFTLGLVVSLYFVGEFLNKRIWGKVHQQLETTKGRRKTK